MNFRAAGRSRKGAKTQRQAVLALRSWRLGVGQVNFAPWRWWAPLVIALALLCLAQAAFAQPPAPADGTIPPEALANRLVNGSFECGGDGYYAGPVVEGSEVLIPNGWGIVTGTTTPVVYSARIFFERRVDPVNGGCDTSNAHVERLDGRDSFYVRALDLETNSEPGKPFDVALVQQVATVSGLAYSLSGWMVSFCGGSFNDPNDCPEGYYIAKMLGADPTGGSDPLAESVVWTENRNNFNDGRWRNLRIGVTAQAPTMTVFARVDSPFRWHGNHAFMDAMTMVQAPTATITASSTISNPRQVLVEWDGALGPDIPLIDGGAFVLLYEIEYRHDSFGAWRKLETDFLGSGNHTVQVGCLDTPYRFRARVRAEQLTGTGVFPTQRYIGANAEIDYTPAAPPQEPGEPLPAPLFSLYLPAVVAQPEC
jgi:hypothetical protein